MSQVCPSCHVAFEPAIAIRGARCAPCLARSGHVSAGDRFGRALFRAGPDYVEFDRVPPQRWAIRDGVGAVVLFTLTPPLLIALTLHDVIGAPTVELAKVVLAGVVAFGLAGLLLASSLVPLSFRHALRANPAGLQLGRWRGAPGSGVWRPVMSFASRKLARLRAFETPLGHGLLAQLHDGTEVQLAGDLTDPDDAARLATALREVLQITASEPLRVGARVLEPREVTCPASIALEHDVPKLLLHVGGRWGADFQADDDTLRVRRPLVRTVELLADDVTGIDAEEVVRKPGAEPTYRVVAHLRRGRAVLAEGFSDPAEAQFLRGRLARALGLEG
ncbi:MAG: hypothetical protein JST54_35295 [Deltaproteobacteria bacterium]|nr:hypothetical protein [Deltaproteobacteria bacterium]